MENISLEVLFKKHIKHTEHKQIVVNKTIHLCSLTNAVLKACSFSSPKVYLNSKILKHLYDKKPAEEMDAIIKHCVSVIKYPDKIYKNKESKKGTFCLTKKIKNNDYLASIEIVKETQPDGLEVNGNYLVTCFRVRDDKYLKKYELFWSWKDGEPSS